MSKQALQAELDTVQRSIRNAEAALIKGIKFYPTGESLGLMLATWYLMQRHLQEKLAQDDYTTTKNS